MCSSDLDVILPTGAMTGVLGVPLLIYLVLYQRKVQREEALTPTHNQAAVPLRDARTGYRRLRAARPALQGRPPGLRRDGLWKGELRMFETLRTALSSLLANKTRSLLTMLGVVIGVGAVIAMVAVGNGASVQMQDLVSGLGSNLLILSPGAPRSGGVRQSGGTRLTLSDVRAEIGRAHV